MVATTVDLHLYNYVVCAINIPWCVKVFSKITHELQIYESSDIYTCPGQCNRQTCTFSIKIHTGGIGAGRGDGCANTVGLRFLSLRLLGVLFHVPIDLLVSRKKQIDPDGLAWAAVLAATGQPAKFD